MIGRPEIKLRAPEPSDIDAMYLWENISDEWAHGVTRVPVSRKMLWDYVENYSSDVLSSGQLRLIITDAGSEAAVGCIDIYEIDAINRRAGVGVVIAPMYRGQGYAYAAVEAIQRYAYRHLGLHQLWAVVASGNISSRHLFESCGFEVCGHLRSWIREGEKYGDAYMYQHLLIG